MGVLIALASGINAFARSIAALSNSVAPAVSGTPAVGNALAASAGTWSTTPDSYLYQWRRGGRAITGATTSSYTLVQQDANQAITVDVTAVKANYTSALARSPVVSVQSSGANTSMPTTGLQHQLRVGALTGMVDGQAISSVAFQNGGVSLTSTGSARPVYVASGVKNQAAMRFDGIDDQLALSAGGIAISQPITIALIVNIADATSGQEVIRFGDVEVLLNASGQNGYQSYNGSLLSAGTVTTGMHSIVLTAPGDGSVQIRVDGTVVGGGYAGTQGISSNTLYLGSFGGQRYFKGDIYQVLTYNRSLADTASVGDLTALNNYFYLTYGIGVLSAPAGPGMATGFTAAFGTRPTSNAMTYSGLNGGTISNLQFSSIQSDTSAIRLDNCANVIIEQCDFTDCCQPITLTNCTNITIRWCRARNITGPHDRNGSNRGNFTQWIYCTRGYIGYNNIRDGDTEDVVSIYKSDGLSTDPIVVEYNRIENETYSSASGSGIMLGDGGGTYQIARYNEMLNPGQVGVACSGGAFNSILANIIYGEQKPTSNIGMYACDYSQTAGGMHDITVQDNRVYFLKNDGTVNGFYTDGTAGTIIGQNSNNLNDSTIMRAPLIVTL